MKELKKIIENDSTGNSAQCFKASIYKDSTGKSNKMYVMDRDGFTFLVMGFTGKKVNEWKWQYIKAFNRMEKFIREKQTKDLLLIYLQFNDSQKKEFLPMPRSMGMTFFDSINKVLRMRKKVLRT